MSELGGFRARLKSFGRLVLRIIGGGQTAWVSVAEINHVSKASSQKSNLSETKMSSAGPDGGILVESALTSSRTCARKGRSQGGRFVKKYFCEGSLD